MRQLVKFIPDKDGNLHIKLLYGYKKELKEMLKTHVSWDMLFFDVCEYELCNGWSIVNPEDIGALTDAPIVSCEIKYFEDSDEIEDIGKVYWFPNYMVQDPLEILLKEGEVVFTGEL